MVAKHIDIAPASPAVRSLVTMPATEHPTAFAAPRGSGQTVWPPIEQVLAAGRLGSHSEQLKHALRMFVAGRHRPRLLHALDRAPLWQEMFRRNPRCFFPPLSHFLDRRWGVRHRFEACLTDLEVARAKFDWSCARMIALGHRQPLIQNSMFELSLGPNGVNLQEGYWALTLHAPDGTALFNLSFGFTSYRSVLVASIQGAAAARQEGDEQGPIQTMTKAAHGLRPVHLLLAAFQLLCSTWGVDEIVGIDPVHHIKGRWNQRRSRLKFDYRAAWQEAGGTQRSDGNWALPPLPRRRTEEDTPSRKRAQYRRRYLMLDEMATQLAQRAALA